MLRTFSPCAQMGGTHHCVYMINNMVKIIYSMFGGLNIDSYLDTWIIVRYGIYLRDRFTV